MPDLQLGLVGSGEVHASEGAVTYSATMLTGANFLLVFVTSHWTAGGGTTSPTVTYDGVAMTATGTGVDAFDGSSPYVRATNFYLSQTGYGAPFPTTAKNIVVTHAGTNKLTSGAAAFGSVDQVTPISQIVTAGSGAGITDTVVSDIALQLVFDVNLGLGVGACACTQTITGSNWYTDHVINPAGGGGAGSSQHYLDSGVNQVWNFSAAARWAVASVVLKQTQLTPLLPQTFIDTTYREPTGTIRNVASGGDLQTTLNDAVLGDVIVLAAAGTWTGNYVLPEKTGTGWIYIRGANYAALPAPGTRVVPATHAAQMPKLSSTTDKVFISQNAAHHYRLVGLDLTVTSATGFNIIELIRTGATSVAQMPHDIVIDRCYIHGNPTGNLTHGIYGDGPTMAVIDSHIDEIHHTGSDNQTIGFVGPGPYKIVNNYLSASCEGVMFGGVDPTVSGVIPTDIEVRRNHLFKPLAWQAASWSVKNSFELKSARRALIEGNLFENVWFSGQDGAAIVFTPRNQSGGAPWTTIDDITFQYNIVRGANKAVRFIMQDDINTSQRGARWLFQHNVFEAIGIAPWGAAGTNDFLQHQDHLNVVTFRHNTFVNASLTYFLVATRPDSLPPLRKCFYWTFTDNIALAFGGILGDYGAGTGTTAIAAYYDAPTDEWINNAMIGGNASMLPSGNLYPADVAAVGFVNYAGGNFRLAPSSPYKNAGTDGTDLGANITQLQAVMLGDPTPVGGSSG